MNDTRKTIVVGAIVSVLLLAGCSASPERSDVVERFAIELEAPFGESAAGSFDEVAEGLADDALDGKCASDAYRAQLVEKSLLDAWDITCLMHFEHDMSDAQIATATESIDLN